MAPPPRQHDIVMPDLDLPDVVMSVSVWLVPLGRRVVQGDRVVEILAGDVTVDLAATLDGILTERLAQEDDLVQPGQILGRITSSE